MKVCNEIKRRIDEADHVESFDLDIARHTAACADCRRFAGERAALRELVASTARVTAPINFDAMLHARLAEVKAHRPLAWLNAAFYLRAGATMAALVVAVLVGQYTGLFNASPTKKITQPEAGSPFTAVTPPTSSQPESPVVSPSVNAKDNDVARGDAPSGRPTSTALAVNGRGGNHLPASHSGSRRGSGVPLVTPEEAGMVDSGAIFIPGRNGQHDVTVPTVSVGAQPLIYVNASRQQPSARAVSVSF
jgi:hypothetical protein